MRRVAGEIGTTVDDLASLDAAMYRNLVKLKTYTGNVEDLSLYFSVTLDRTSSEPQPRSKGV